MTRQILDGIVAALRAAFPEVARVYTEQVKQGLKTPCFIVRMVNHANEPRLGTRCRRTSLFSVQYIPKSATDANTQCCDVNDRLYSALEYITADSGLYRGTNMSGQYTDGILTFLVSFNTFVKTEPSLNPMEQLKVKNQVKRGAEHD